MVYSRFDLADILASLEPPFPINKGDLVDFCNRSCAPLELIEEIARLPDNDTLYKNVDSIFPEKRKDYYFQDDDDL